MTSIHLPGVSGSAGYADYGRKTVAEMLALVRAYARESKAAADAVLAAADDEFCIATYVGVHRQRDYTIIQEGRAKAAEAEVATTLQVPGIRPANSNPESAT